MVKDTWRGKLLMWSVFAGSFGMLVIALAGFLSGG
jgi:hypothetical protein